MVQWGYQKHGKGGKRDETFLDLFDLRGGNVRHRFCSLRVRQMEGEKGALAGAGKGAVFAGSFRGSLGVSDGNGGLPAQDEPLVLPDRGAGAFFALDGGDRGTDLENGALKDFDGKPLRKKGGCGILKPVCPKPQGK